MRNLMSYGLALIIILVVGLWLATGSFVQGGNGPGEGERTIASIIEPDGGAVTQLVESTGLAQDHAENDENHADLSIAERNELIANEAGAARSVRIKQFIAQPFPIEVPLRGRTEARSSVSAAAETSGFVDKIHVAKGDSVEVGQLLCTIDRGTRQANVDQAQSAILQAQAALDQATSNAENNQTLRDRGVAAANTAMQFEVALAGAEAQLLGAQSNLDNALAELDRTEVRARVAGVVTEPLANDGALLNIGSPCATVVQLDPIVFVGFVPEARIGLASLGLPVDIETVAGDTFSGEVAYIAPVADATTRSFRVEVAAENDGGTIRDGLTASATVKVGTLMAQLIPQSVLTLGPDGEIGVRSVSDNIVQFHELTIVSDTREGIWVTGLPLVVDVITIGQENVQAGQVVSAATVEEEEAGASA